MHRVLLAFALAAFLAGLMASAHAAGPESAAPPRLAVLLPASGPDQSVGREMERGLLLAEEALAAEGPAVTFLRIDTMDSPIGGKLAAEAAAESGAVAAVACGSCLVSQAMADVLQTHGVPCVSVGSPKASLTVGRDYIFRLGATDEEMAKALAGRALQRGSNPKVGVLVNLHMPSSQRLAEAFSRLLSEAGGQVLVRYEHPRGAVDFAAVIGKLVEADVDVVFMPGQPRDLGLFARQFRGAAGPGHGRRGEGPDILGGFLCDRTVARYGGPAAEGIRCLRQWLPGDMRPRSLAFVERYRERFGEEPLGDHAAMTYDAAVLAGLAGLAGLDGQGGRPGEQGRAAAADLAERRGAARRFLATRVGRQGVTGVMTFDAQGDLVGKELFVVTWRDGAWRLEKP